MKKIAGLNVTTHKELADMIWEKGDFKISTEKKHVDIDILHDMLSHSYWAKDRSREDVKKSVANSLCFSLLKGEKQTDIIIPV